MGKNLATHATFLTTTSVVALSIVHLVPGLARAECQPDPVADGGTVICSGTDTDGFRTGSRDVDVIVNAGGIVAPPSGGAILLDGQNATLVNNGTVSVVQANANFLTGAQLQQEGVIRNAEGALVEVTGSEFVTGLRTREGEIVNEGIVRVSGERSVDGIVASNGSAVTNAEGALIEIIGTTPDGTFGSDFTAMSAAFSGAEGRPNVLTNSGSLVLIGSTESSNMSGMEVRFSEAADIITNTATGSLSLTGRDVTGIQASVNDTVTNAGSIEITATDNSFGFSRGAGIRAFSAVNVRNSGSITVSGDQSSGVVFALFSQGGTLQNSGLIETTGAGSGLSFEGGETGIELDGSPAVLLLGQNAALTNSGTLRARGETSAGVTVGGRQDFPFDDGVVDYDGNTILNTGLIEGGAAGISLVGNTSSGTPTLTINNSVVGRIEGLGTNGVPAAGIRSVDGSVIIDNAGLVLGNYSGIEIEGGSGSDIANLAGGIIRATGEDPAGAAIRVTGSPASIVNAGLIDGGATGNAIILDGGSSNILEVRTGSTIQGRVDVGAGGIDRFVFGGSTDQTFDVSAFDGNGVATAGEQYFGFEVLEKRDNSGLTLTGEQDELSTFFGIYEGAVRLEGGSLASISASVYNDASLTGIGTVGGLEMLGNSDLVPGLNGSVGQLTVVNNLLLGANSRLLVDVAPDGASSDIVVVGGVATIEEGVALVANGLPGDYPEAGLYTVLTAEGGINGRFGSVTDNLPDLDLLAVYEANRVQLSYTQEDNGSGEPPPTPGNGLTRKENALASIHGMAQTSMGFSETMARRAVLTRSLASETRVRGADALNYDRETGIAAQPAAQAIYGTDLSLYDVERPTGGKPYGFWVSAFGDFFDVEPTGDASGYESRSAGVAGGLEYSMSGQSSTAVVGLAGGYSRTDVDVVDGGGEIDTGHVGVYGAFDRGALSLNAALAYSFGEFNLDRAITLLDGRSVTATGTADGQAVSGYAEVGYDLVPGLGGSGYSLMPSARIRGVHASRDGFVEHGAGILDLTVREDEVSLLYGGIGLRAGAELRVGEVLLTPSLALFYEHNLADETESSLASLAGGSATFLTPVSSGGGDLFSVSAGLGARFGGSISGHLRYDGSFGDEVESHRGSAGLSFRF